MASPCPRCGGDLDDEGLCAACAFAGVLDENVASAAPLSIEEAAEQIAERRRLVELAPVGRGGMGFVYRARQVQLDREVALKLFSSGSHERFEREARLLASLSHPHIVAIHDFGSEDGTPYIVMEYMDGPSVRTLIDMGGLSRARALEILEQAGRAIEYAHARGVIHRDIKPENVLTSVDGVVKVGDFGIARLANQEGDPGTGSGTPAYMAPERRHIPGAADERSDIYSLGALAWEMLETVGPIDAPLQDFIRRAMDPEPNRRFQSATEFLAGLRDLGDHPRALPRRLPPRERMRRLALSKLFWFLLASSGVEVLGLLVWLTVFASLSPADLFEAHLRNDTASVSKPGNSLQLMPPIEIDSLVAREVHSADLKRAGLALDVAYFRNREDAVPAELRLKLYRSIHSKPYGWWHGASIWEPAGRAYLLESILRDGGPDLGRRLFDELASPKAPARDIPLLVLGIAWTADGPLCLEIAKRLQATPRPANAYALLLALAARIDVPLPVDESVIPTYERFLPELLDPAGEARWEVAARLALELPKSDDLDDWRAEFLPRRGGALTPENLAAGRDIPWPWKEMGFVRGFEGSIRHNSRRTGSYYIAAVMTRWHETNRFTLPHYPYGHDPTVPFQMHLEQIDLSQALRRERFNSVAKAVLLPGQSMPWECAYLHINTLAGRPDVKAHARGRGNVDFTRTFETEVPGTLVQLSLGIGPLVPTRKERTLPGTIEIKGEFSREYPGVVRFTGRKSLSDPFGGGSGTTGGISALSETMVTQVTVWSRSGRDFRSGYAVLMFPDPKPGIDFETRWRLGIRDCADRLAISDLSFIQQFEVGELLSFTMIAPVPEAIPGLRKLWERRGEFESRAGISGLFSLKHGDAIGAALLMAGDHQQLKETALLSRFPKDLASRIFLFSPNSEVREAFAESAAQPLGPGDAEAVDRVLTARGDRTSPLAREAAKGIENGRRDLLLAIAPYAAVAAFLLVFGWSPRNRGHLPAVAASIVFTGVLFRLLKLQVGDVVWIPVLGDLLLLISAFLYGGWALKLLTTGMILSSILQLMMSETPGPAFASNALFSVYLAGVCLDALSRRLPGTIPRRFGLAILATWWTLIVPTLFATGAGLLFGKSSIAVSISGNSEPALFLLAAAIVIPPLVVVGFERSRRLTELETFSR